MINAKVLLIGEKYDFAKIWVPSLAQLRVQARVVSYDQLPDAPSLCQNALIMIDDHTAGDEINSICRIVRRQYPLVLLALTYERDERFHLQLYDNGIDEVIVKPLGVPLFLAKTSVWLRRVEHVGHSVEQLQAAHFQLEPNRKRLVIDNERTMRLSTLECNLLTLLMVNQGQVLETDLIIDRVWPNYGNGDKDLLKNLIYRLRRKIEPDPAAPQYIHTINGHGYTFRVD